jgi:hypothetical protein
VTSDAMPFSTRSEFIADQPWGNSAGVRRYEMATPLVEDVGETKSAMAAISDVACFHAARSSLILRVGGGHLRAPRDRILAELSKLAPSRLTTSGTAGPAHYVDRVVSWLEQEQQDGILERSYTTATLVVAVGNGEVWTWQASPHGLVHKYGQAFEFVGTDLRNPVLRAHGVIPPMTLNLPGAVTTDQASSIFCLGTPLGYERIRRTIEPGESVFAFERASLPFGPWPTERLPPAVFWRMDAAWRHGAPGRAVVVGYVAPQDLDPPIGWEMREVPLDPSQP